MSKKQPKQVIAFDPRERARAAVHDYIADPERFLADQGRAIPLLLRAYEAADDARRHEIVRLLGGVSRPEAARGLYGILGDTATSEEIRLAAAVQLCVTLPLLADSAGLIERLLADLRSASAPWLWAGRAISGRRWPWWSCSSIPTPKCSRPPCTPWPTSRMTGRSSSWKTA